MTLIPGAIDALVAGFDGVLSIPVVDGPPTTNVENTSLFVGCDADLDEHTGTVPFEQRWAGLGHVKRDETFGIPCLLYYFNGDDDMSAARLAVKTYKDLIESYLRANETLGFAATSNVRAQFAPSGTWTSRRTAKGIEMSIPFTVNIEGRV